MIAAVAWKDDALELLDQTRLPEATVYVKLRRVEEVYEAIQSLRVRGAPAIGISAAYGLYLAVHTAPADTAAEFFGLLEEKIQYLSTARPTAVNLVWALRHIKARLEEKPDASPNVLKARLLELAKELHEDDRSRCQRMAEHGQKVLPDGARIMTHCNTGALATGGIGTAFGVIYQAHVSGKKVQVYANETRPLLQGARLTMYELMASNIPAELVCDSTAATLMQQGKVDLVIVGADRIAADGSTANKIGTYPLAICAKHHQVPFYVAAPFSTVDLSLRTGSQIPIENRSPEEVRRVLGGSLITLPEAPCWNPAFDVTPPELITGIITERGIIGPPYEKNLAAFRE